MIKPQNPAKRHKVTLLRDHEHGGKKCRASETIEVTTPELQWLVAHHVIAPPEPQAE